jgi:hypothetical protein
MFQQKHGKATHCTFSNMKDKIGKHNAKVLNKENDPEIEIVNGAPKPCCDDQANCPLMTERCDQTNVIYQAD